MPRCAVAQNVLLRADGYRTTLRHRMDACAGIKRHGPATVERGPNGRSKPRERRESPPTATRAASPALHSAPRVYKRAHAYAFCRVVYRKRHLPLPLAHRLLPRLCHLLLYTHCRASSSHRAPACQPIGYYSMEGGRAVPRYSYWCEGIKAENGRPVSREGKPGVAVATNSWTVRTSTLLLKGRWRGERRMRATRRCAAQPANQAPASSPAGQSLYKMELGQNIHLKAWGRRANFRELSRLAHPPNHPIAKKKATAWRIKRKRPTLALKEKP